MRFSRSIFTNTALVTAAVGSCIAAVAWLGLRGSGAERALRDRTAISMLLAGGIHPGEFADARPRDLLLLRLQRVVAGLPELQAVTLFEAAGSGDWAALLDAGSEPGPRRLLLEPQQLQTLATGNPLQQDAGASTVLLAPVQDDAGALRGVARVQFASASTAAAGAGVRLFALALALGLGCGLIAVRLLGHPIERLFARAGRTRAGDASPSLQRLAVDLEELVDRMRRQGDAPERDADAFLANTVHELRTPLTTILASLDMLRDGYASDPRDQREFLEQATMATHHLMFVVNDLLDSAALESGRLQVDLQPCFVRELLGDTMRLLRPLALARGVTLALQQPAGDPRVLADRNRALQVLFNLLANALKFTPRDGHVELRAERRDGTLVFEVQDDGPGVPPHAQDLLFTRFGRAAGDGAPRIGGTGIGLYLSKALVEQMQGRIGYRPAEPGPGALFWFELPAMAASAAVPASPRSGT